jgi:branched-chain amino acid transport system permease protein
MKLPKWQWFIPILIVIFLFVLPLFMHSPRYLSLFNQLFFNTVLALGVYSVWTIGYINASQPIFFGLGAYTVAILMTRTHWPFWAVFPMAGIIPAIIAALFGFLGLKLKGAYFLFLTIAFCDLLEWMFMSWKSLFGGQVGIFPVPQPKIHLFGYFIDFSRSLVPYYFLALILVVVTCLVYFKLHGSRLGRVWQCVAKNEDILANTGISVFTQKQIVFITSCFFAGLAGAIYAPYMTIVSPTQFNLWQGIWIVLGVLVGGIFSPIGAIIGTVFMAVLTFLLQKSVQFQPLILGMILILTLLFMPTGLFGLPGRIINKIREVSSNKNAKPEIKKTI